MILNIDDIYDNVESFRNSMGYSQEKMADLMGLSTKQAYKNMIDNKTMKMSYFINLLNNTNKPANFFIRESRFEQQVEEPALDYNHKSEDYGDFEMLESRIEDLEAKLDGLLAILDIRKERGKLKASAVAEAKLRK